MADMRHSPRHPSPVTDGDAPTNGYRERYPDSVRATGWAGWTIFAGVMAILIGAFQLIAGLVSLLNSGFYLVPPDWLVIHVDYATWGWIHVGVGFVALATSVGLLSGQAWARVLGIVMAVVSAIVSLAFIAAFPIWATIIIGFDVLLIYAIAIHGGELVRR